MTRPPADLSPDFLVAPVPARPRGGARTILLGMIFFLSGVCALLYQLSWQRLLFTAFGVDIDSVTIIVSTFMLGLGVGALAGGLLADRFPRHLVAIFAACELGIALFGSVSVPLIRAVGEAFVAGSPATVLVANFLLLLVPTTMMGATLPVLVTDAVRRHGGVGVSTGTLYFANTLGAACGALAIAVGLYIDLGLRDVIRLAVAGNLVVAATGTLLHFRGRAL